jgi:hypothetical protein
MNERKVMARAGTVRKVMERAGTMLTGKPDFY